MGIEARIEDYFAAWNERDPEAVAASFTDDGTFEDPTTGGPVPRDGIAAMTHGWFDGFPDGRIPLTRLDVVAPDRAIAQFRMIGTNTGDTPTGPATGGAIDLPGVDLIGYDPATDRLRSVRGHWDLAGMLMALGLQLNPTPASIEGLLDFGSSVHVWTGRTEQPGCFTVTSTDAAPQDTNWVNASAEAIVQELFAVPGYLGSVMCVAGGRHFTFSAWDSPESVVALRGTGHAQAQRTMLSGERCRRIMTSLWSPLRLNPVKVGTEGGRPAPADGTDQWL